MQSQRDLPPAFPALWRSMQLGYRAEPLLLVTSFVITILATLPEALFALWLKLLAEGALHHDRPRLFIAALGLGGSAVAAWVLRTLGDRMLMRFRERATIALEAHVARLQATVASIELHERPEYLDRLTVLREQVFFLNHLYLSLFSTVGSLLRLVITIGLLVSVHPALAALALFAVPTVAVSSWRSGVQRKVEEQVAPHSRLARHFFTLGTTPAPGKEVRLAGNGPRLIAERRAAWDAWYRPIAAARWTSACWQALAWALFGSAYAVAIIFVAAGLHASPGNVLLVLAAGSRLSQYVSTTVGEADFLRMWLESSRRLLWLERYATAHQEHADQPVPERIARGVRLENVSFRYPGTERLVLEGVDLELPAGAVVAVVGENGAGKSTLIKLLCRFYEPSGGRITVDGADLGRMPADVWRRRLAGAFQDFFKFEFKASHTVGLGDLDRLDERAAVGAAVERAGAADVVAHLSQGLDTQLGPSWKAGADLSFGQWQKLGLARGFMRDRPLLLVLDEPTAAIDAETEHALFERFAEQSRRSNADGRITLLVSHRFSTVRMADLIVVLDGARVAEYGSHDALMARNGTYADLYRIQAHGYRQTAPQSDEPAA